MTHPSGADTSPDTEPTIAEQNARILRERLSHLRRKSDRMDGADGNAVSMDEINRMSNEELGFERATHSAPEQIGTFRRLWNGFKADPLPPTGVIVSLGIVFAGLISSANGNVFRSNLLMRARMGVHILTVSYISYRMYGFQERMIREQAVDAFTQAGMLDQYPNYTTLQLMMLRVPPEVREIMSPAPLEPVQRTSTAAAFTQYIRNLNADEQESE
ncbi:hypothetical protein H696_04930 [Fonticula alba]|uniref:HIG1 domain-containing protein n=1 Tax=Fonticula alba TaxID=691883 RepID=A0A058Z2X4_FONAL|nr:hypothetical protein H696_04930 [Fonticula alba]KCV68639.1 hypothetical protein H696_04930 [Fonticula alba]|eukprot:XP_009497071.1 hypothetical protein H696_04930 [Fonticula alba]